MTAQSNLNNGTNFVRPEHYFSVDPITGRSGKRKVSVVIVECNSLPEVDFVISTAGVTKPMKINLAELGAFSFTDEIRV